MSDPTHIGRLRAEEITHSAPNRIGPITLVLMALSVVVAIWSKLGANDDALDWLFISTQRRHGPGIGLPEIGRGEVWRILTPAFIHFGIMHLVFNMMWLKDLGTVIERLVGSWTFVGLALVSEVIGNLGQYFVSGPFFGGMSGVVYCLFGFVWMQAKFNPASGFRLDKQTVLWMIGWFVLCLTGVVGPVANVGHAAGLAVGVLWGYVSARRGRAS